MAGLATVLGSGAMTNSIDDATKASTILLMGSNATETHPVIGAKIKQAIRKGSKLVVADPRKTELARLADIHLQLKPGTDAALLNGLLHIIIDKHLVDKEYISQHTEGYEQLAEHVKSYTPERVSAITGVPVHLMRQAALTYGRAAAAAVLYTMGITQHSNGTDNVLAIANLALATGNLGRPGTGINPLRGQNNVQGSCDMGALPNVLPGYVPVEQANQRFGQIWQAQLPEQKGMTVGQMIDGGVRALYVMGENPMLSDPDGSHVAQCLDNLDFLVVQDIFLTETAERADVVLPAASFAEKEGSFTNTERRVQKVNQAIAPVGQSRPDWQIICDIAQRLGHNWHYSFPGEIFAEINQAVPAYGGFDYNSLESDGRHWPCPETDHPGTPILHAQGPARGRGVFTAVDYKGPGEAADEQYPYTLTTGRILFHYHTGTMTRNARGLGKHRKEEQAEINPADAAALGIASGDRVKITSRRGSVETAVIVTDRVPEKVVFMTFHFRESAANILTGNFVDPVSLTPELKVAAVAIEKVV